MGKWGETRLTKGKLTWVNVAKRGQLGVNMGK